MLDALLRVFPIEGEQFRVEVVGEPLDDAENLRLTLRLLVFDRGGIRDIKEQEVAVLPLRHVTPRGLAYLEACARHARTIDRDVLETSMPHDLFPSALLDAPVEDTAFAAVLADSRARVILERRPDDARLLATLQHPRAPMLSNPALEARIAENPDDPGAYSVYGDWLAEHGDPRGELVALQISQSDRAAELIDLRAYEWLGDFAWSPPGEVEVTWRYGFIDAIVCRVPEGDYALRDARGDIQALADIPGTRFMRRLELRGKDVYEGDVFTAIAEYGVPASLEHLAIHTPEYGHLGDVSPAYPALGQLTELVLQSRSMELGEIELPALRSLELVTRGLTRANLRALRTGQLPRLERLVLWLGDDGLDDCDVTLDDLDWIFAGENLRGVRTLGLCGRGPRDLVERLATAPIVRQLDVLDIAGGYLADDDRDTLRAHRDAFAHLRALHVPASRAANDIAPNVVLDERFIPVYE